MADIQQFPVIRHLRGTPALHVRHQRNGKLVHAGTGLSFWFRPLSAVLSEVPVDDRELPLLFHGRTADFQDVTVQATVTFRVANPAVASTRVDFSIDPESGTWRSRPLDQVSGVLTELAQQHALELLASGTLAQVLAAGPGALRERIEGGLAGDPRLRDIGLAVVGVRVIAVRPEPEMERALQTPTREQVQQASDRATFERRALAVESERAIAENELQSRIELAVREEQLVAQQGQNERRRAQESAAADAIAAAADAERERTMAASKANTARVVGAAEAESTAASLAAYATIDPTRLLALALRELANGGLPEIGTLNLSPDLLSTALARFSGEKV